TSWSRRTGRCRHRFCAASGQTAPSSWVQRLSDRTWSKLESGPEGPVVQQEPSEQWLPAAEHGAPLRRAAQAARGRSGKPIGQGRELLVDRVGVNELRIGEVTGNATSRSWRITSARHLG